MQGPQYKNPPISEAIVEIQFVPSPSWNWTVPGRLFDALRAQYPETARDVSAVQGLPPGIVLANAPIARVHLQGDNGTRLVGIAPNAISMHALRPYGGWDEFRQRIALALAAYRNVVGVVHVGRIGLRYINRIEIPDASAQSLDLDAYFEIGPFLPHADGLPRAIAEFTTRTRAPYDDGALLTVTMASQPDGNTILLDIDVAIDGQAEPLDVEDLMRKVDSLKVRERAAFESIIRDPTRRLFD